MRRSSFCMSLAAIVTLLAVSAASAAPILVGADAPEMERAKGALEREIEALEARYEEGMAAVLDELKRSGVEKSGSEIPYIGQGCSQCGRETCSLSAIAYYPRGLGIKKNVEISEGSAGVKGKRIFRYSHKRQKKMKELFDIQTELKEKRRRLSRYALED